MEEPALALVLAKCLTEVEAGADPQEVARRYPLLQADLLPLLRTAVALRNVPDAPVPTDFLTALGKQLRAAG